MTTCSRQDAPPKASSDPMTVRAASDCPDWRSFLAGRDDASIYCDPRWGEVMHRAYGNRPHYLTACRGPEIVGALMLIEQRSFLFGRHLCSVPYFDAVGALGEGQEATSALLAEAESLRLAVKAEHVELRQLSPLEGLPARTDKLTLWLDLPSESEALWDGLKAKVRNQVRKAEKAGMTAETGGAELLGAFHSVYVRNMRDLGSPPHSRRFYRLILDVFGEAAALHVVRLDSRPVAASLTLTDAGATHVPWAGSDWRYRSDCPNMLLYWSMLRGACGRSPRFDFGRSSTDSGTLKFKRQWGAADVPLYWHYLPPDDADPTALGPDSAKYRLLTAAWRRLPVGAARMIGPRIISKLS